MMNPSTAVTTASVLKNDLQTFDYKRLILPAVALLVLAWMLLPDMAFAAASDTANDTMKTVKDYFTNFLIFILYALEGIVFVAAAIWIIKAVSDWINKERDGTIGRILITILVSIAVVGIVFVLATKGIDIIETKIKDVSVSG